MSLLQKNLLGKKVRHAWFVDKQLTIELENLDTVNMVPTFQDLGDVKLGTALSDETIDQHLAGRTIEHVWTDGKKLIIQTKCGHFVNVVWVDGNPRLHSVDVRFSLPEPTECMGIPGVISGSLK